MSRKTTGKRDVRYELSYGSDAEMLLDFKRQIETARDEAHVARLVACFTAITQTAALMGDFKTDPKAEEKAEIAFYQRLASERIEQLRTEQAELAKLDEIAAAAASEVSEDEHELVLA